MNRLKLILIAALGLVLAAPGLVLAHDTPDEGEIRCNGGIRQIWLDGQWWDLRDEDYCVDPVPPTPTPRPVRPEEPVDPPDEVEPEPVEPVDPVDPVEVAVSPPVITI